jgi:regulator of replication initiation timing
MDHNNRRPNLTEVFNDLIEENHRLQSDNALLQAKLASSEACLDAIKSFLKGDFSNED